MDETSEKNPATNFQKTVVAQKDRTEAAAHPLNLIDRFTGKYTSGRVESNYRDGFGGTIHTSIESGQAILSQSWTFDKDGNLSRVVVNKIYNGSEASKTVLERDTEGKFRIRETRSNNLLSYWEKNFNTARQRITGNKN